MTNCFCVPHKEHDDQVEAEISYAADVNDLNRRVNHSENIVGKRERVIFCLLDLLLKFQIIYRMVGYWK